MTSLAICLDFDGTLVDSEPLHYEAWSQELAQFGVGLDEQEYLAHFCGMATADTACALVVNHGLPIDAESLKARKMSRFTELLRHKWPPKVAGADELLAALSTLSLPVALVTGAYRHEVEPVLDHYGWRHYFTLLVTRDDVTTGKPHPEPYLLATRSLGVAASGCFAIEDSLTGMQSALGAGLQTLQLRTPYLTAGLPDEVAGAIVASEPSLPALASWLMAKLRAN